MKNTEKVVILSVEEQNYFYNADLAANGGGYAQPFTTFMYMGIVGTVDNTSCGDFGIRIFVSWNGYEYTYNNLENDCCNGEWSTFPNTEVISDLREAGIPICSSVDAPGLA